jgi:hypothetical protein
MMNGFWLGTKRGMVAMISIAFCSLLPILYFQSSVAIEKALIAFAIVVAIYTFARWRKLLW